MRELIGGVIKYRIKGMAWRMPGRGLSPVDCSYLGDLSLVSEWFSRHARELREIIDLSRGQVTTLPTMR